MIDHGLLVYDGDLAGLRSRVRAQRTLVVDLATPGPPITLPGANVVRVDGPRQWLAFPAQHSAAGLVADLAARYEVADLSVREPDIEDVIHRLYATDDAIADRGVDA